ncbi:CRP-like cAMP-binding protein [Pseudorhizobium tarimense]|uniref:CRP-like cAMP-binding protein n=1 Tax=Pseudorhizobium tarimense TaxID=1079109 RepID=A0ABV2H4A4_9HYPH|nr:Crp/Fnr family transcriptional regulator [Pseudorhizobium tarimense]MCJ8518602.1 Crp/Fnr family transcriptional regulator [Pseudorhizobium tarimense]
MGLDSYVHKQVLTPGHRKGGVQLSRASLRRFPAGTTVFDDDCAAPRLLLVENGWLISSKTMSNGTRIVTDFFLPGDILSSVSAAMSHETVHTVCDVSCYEIPGRMTVTGGDGASQVPLIMTIELMKRHARITERLASIGRRDAFGRAGHLLLELAVRAGKSMRPGLDGFECPLTQAEIGDALGLSTVHVNRVLKEMRLSGLLSFRNGVVEFLNRGKLAELVDFDPSYLTGSTEDVGLQKT